MEHFKYEVFSDFLSLKQSLTMRYVVCMEYHVTLHTVSCDNTYVISVKKSMQSYKNLDSLVTISGSPLHCCGCG